jgi:hypothetical protein
MTLEDYGQRCLRAEIRVWAVEPSPYGSRISQYSREDHEATFDGNETLLKGDGIWGLVDLLVVCIESER